MAWYFPKQRPNLWCNTQIASDNKSLTLRLLPIYIKRYNHELASADGVKTHHSLKGRRYIWDRTTTFLLCENVINLEQCCDLFMVSSRVCWCQQPVLFVHMYRDTFNSNLWIITHLISHLLAVQVALHDWILHATWHAYMHWHVNLVIQQLTLALAKFKPCNFKMIRLPNLIWYYLSHYCVEGVLEMNPSYAPSLIS